MKRIITAFFIIFPFVGSNVCFADIPALTAETPVAMVVILPTQLPTAFATPQFANSGNLKTRTICNATNQDVWCANNAATPIAYNVPAGTCNTENYAANWLTQTKGIGCIHPSSTPSSGTVTIWGSK